MSTKILEIPLYFPNWTLKYIIHSCLSLWPINQFKCYVNLLVPSPVLHCVPKMKVNANLAAVRCSPPQISVCSQCPLLFAEYWWHKNSGFSALSTTCSETLQCPFLPQMHPWWAGWDFSVSPISSWVTFKGKAWCKGRCRHNKLCLFLCPGEEASLTFYLGHSGLLPGPDGQIFL